jgi:hypothetical protein
MRHVSANRHGCTTAHGQNFVLQTWPQRLLQRCKLEKERCTVRCSVVRDCPSVTNPFPREPLLFLVDDHIDHSQLPKSNFISWLLAELLGSFVRPVPHSITTYPDPFGSPTPIHRISFELSPSQQKLHSALASGLPGSLSFPCPSPNRHSDNEGGHRLVSWANRCMYAELLEMQETDLYW